MRMTQPRRSPARRARLALRFGIIPALAWAGSFATPAAAQSVNTNPAAPDYALCSRLLSAAQSPAAEERVVAAAALGDCPGAPNLARLLERAIQDDEAPVRAAAWRSLGAHLDRQSLVFLAEVHAAERLSPAEEVFFYRYVSQLVEAGDAPRFGAILERGLYRPDPEIQSAALLGLGRSRDLARWPAVRSVLERGSIGSLPAALASARLMQAPESLPYGLRWLESPAPGVQAEAIRLLGALGGPRALEALILLDHRGAAGANSAALDAEIAALVRSGRLAGEIFITARPIRLYAQAAERSEITGAVDERRVVYALNRRVREQRIQPRTDRHLISGVWILVSASSGLQGWTHDSQLAPYAPTP